MQKLLDMLGDVVTSTVSGLIVWGVSRAVEKRKPPKGTGKHYKGGKK